MRPTSPLALLCLTGVVVAASGCSAMKNMESMKKTTEDMGKTTKDMAGTTKDMSKTTKDMSETTEEMAETTQGMAKTTDHMAATTDYLAVTASDTYHDLRQGDSSNARRAARDALDRAPVMEMKISEASKYLMAYEFQLWKGHGADNAKIRDKFYLCAAEEFFRDIRAFIPDDRDIDPSSDDNALMNLHAISVALHKINPAATEEVSMLTLIENALKAKKAIERGDIAEANVPEYQHEILLNEQDAIYLLRLRANFLAAMVLGRTSNLGDKDTGFLGLGKLFSGIFKVLDSWTANTPSMNVEQLRTMTTWLHASNETREFLHDHGVKASIDTTLMEIFHNMRIPAAKIAVRRGALGELQSERKVFLKFYQ